MKRLATIVLFLLAASAFAQQNATVSGSVRSELPLPAETRVGVFVYDLDVGLQGELASTAVASNAFEVTTATPDASLLKPFADGVPRLPGLQTEYSVSPANVNYTQALTNVYVDNNGNGAFDGTEVDTGYTGIGYLEGPSGFFVLLYVDKDATLSAQNVALDLKAGWNIVTIRSEGGALSYQASQSVDNAVLDVFPSPSNTDE